MNPERPPTDDKRTGSLIQRHVDATYPTLRKDSIVMFHATVGIVDESRTVSFASTLPTCTAQGGSSVSRDDDPELREAPLSGSRIEKLVSTSQSFGGRR